MCTTFTHYFSIHLISKRIFLIFLSVESDATAFLAYVVRTLIMRTDPCVLAIQMCSRGKSNHWCLALSFKLSSLTTYFSSTESSEAVWVVVGGRAELPCRPNPKQADDDPMLVLWYRRNNRIPIYT